MLYVGLVIDIFKKLLELEKRILNLLKYKIIYVEPKCPEENLTELIKAR